MTGLSRIVFRADFRKIDASSGDVETKAGDIIPQKKLSHNDRGSKVETQNQPHYPTISRKV